MDASVIAAMLTAAGGLATKVIDVWRKGSLTNKGEEAEQEMVARTAAEVITGHYDRLTDGVTNNSVKILKYLEGGDPRRPIEIWKRVFGEELSEPEEFSYRLRYLQTLGLVRGGIQEYRITPLGLAFLHEARKRKDYHQALFS